MNDLAIPSKSSLRLTDRYWNNELSDVIDIDESNEITTESYLIVQIVLLCVIMIIIFIILIVAVAIGIIIWIVLRKK